MYRQKKIMKVLIILIFSVFILSTGLVTVMYLTAPGAQDSSLTGENLTGTDIQTGLNLTGENLDLTGSSITGEID